MCGLVAVVSARHDAGWLERTLCVMTRALAHRGPDHAGWWVRGPVGLGHTRLRVADPTPRADQPQSFDACHLVFAGAIINHVALRRELEREHGVCFQTTGDTEVLLHLLRLHGPEALPRLQGMFAFAFVDERRRRLLLARDRAGIKPLHWARGDNGCLLVASEARAIVQTGAVPAIVDAASVAQLVRFNHPLGSGTFFERVQALEPGTMLDVDVNRLDAAPRRWAELRLAPRPMTLSEAVEELDARFKRAVERAAAVDVPLGVYLSGGVDSGGIAAEVVGQGQRPSLYSLIVEGAGTSESAAIEQTTAHLGVSTRRVTPGPLGLDDLVQYALRAEMPQWWTSDLALGALARAARAEGTTVVLAGEGPDELFAGYDVYRLAPFRPLFTGLARPLAGATRLAVAVGQRFIPWLPIDGSVVDAYLKSHDRGREREVLDHFGFHPEHLATWEALEAHSPLAPALRDQHARHRERERAHFRASLAARAEGLSSTERNLQYEVSERLPQWILHMGDRMSSTHGVELRFPYLDDDFMDAALRLPMDCRSTVRESKRALRGAHRRRLPATVAGRRKQALYTPTRAWLGPVLDDERLSRYWSRQAFERAGLLDFDACEAARARLGAGERPDALTGMVDEWLFVFALTTSILAVEVCGA